MGITFIAPTVILGHLKTPPGLFLAEEHYTGKGEVGACCTVQSVLTYIILFNIHSIIRVTKDLSPFLGRKLRQRIYINALHHTIHR